MGEYRVRSEEKGKYRKCMATDRHGIIAVTVNTASFSRIYVVVEINIFTALSNQS